MGKRDEVTAGSWGREEKEQASLGWKEDPSCRSGSGDGRRLQIMDSSMVLLGIRKGKGRDWYERKGNLRRNG